VTSGVFHSIPIDSITVLREERQRRVIDDIDSLTASIKEIGLIHPLVITRDGNLVTGERRFNAVRKLGWTHVSAQYVDELDNATLSLIELEENIRRKDISWQERTLAIEKYHRLKREADPSWTQEATARTLNATPAHVAQHLTVAREIANPLVERQETFKSALDKAQEVSRRRDDSLIHNVNPVNDTPSPILCADFIEWAQHDQDKFNFIHCDFPYGIDSQSSGQNPSGYTDTRDTYYQLFNALAGNLDNFCAPSAHMIFWFAAAEWQNTWEMLKLLKDFQFDEAPLIWHKSDGKGIIPDPYRRPRRVYEMAFYGWRGDAKILQVRDNLFSAPTQRERHAHEKSQAMLEHFFSMFVASDTRLLDPTAGSASSLRAAKRLGCNQMLGLELSEDFAAIARNALAETSSGDVDPE
jgi:ParB/RepB/Spo0J family partition protein